jgi:maltose O-acetyltransferase
VPSTAQRLDPRTFRRRCTDSVWWNWLVNGVAASPAFGHGARAAILRAGGINVGGALIAPHCFFFGMAITFGDGTWVNDRCYFDNRDRISIGSNCALAMEVMLCTSTHEIGDRIKRDGEYRTAPIEIGDGSWLGTRTLVVPGVKIGPGCVVAAGSVVTGQLEPNGLYAGAPARRIRDLP